MELCCTAGTHCTFVWNFLVSVDETDVVEGSDVWRESAVDAEYLAVDEGRDGQQVEHPAAVLPRVGVTILGLALVVKTVHLCDLP